MASGRRRSLGCQGRLAAAGVLLSSRPAPAALLTHLLPPSSPPQPHQPTHQPSWWWPMRRTGGRSPLHTWSGYAMRLWKRRPTGGRRRPKTASTRRLGACGSVDCSGAAAAAGTQHASTQGCSRVPAWQQLTQPGLLRPSTLQHAAGANNCCCCHCCPRPVIKRTMEYCMQHPEEINKMVSVQRKVCGW